MTAPVTERLDRLATQAPTRLTAPSDLWRRGRHRQLRRWLAGVSALVVVGFASGGLAGHVLAPVQGTVAAEPAGDLRLPDVFRQPGAFEPAFEGPPGPLAAVGLGTRGGILSSENSWWGVSGRTGEARFLDLPDAVVEPDHEPALSADGRRLAYWFTGPTGAEPVVGVAVADLVTGDVRRWRSETARGLWAQGLVWAGDVLWWEAGDLSSTGLVGEPGAATAARMSVHTWDAATDEHATVHGSGISLSATGTTVEGALASVRGNRVRRLEGDQVAGGIAPDPPVSVQGFSAPALSYDGRIAGIAQAASGVVDDTAHPLLVGDVGDDGRARLEEVGDVRALAVLGWRSESEVVVLVAGDPSDGSRARGAVVDVATGRSTPVLEFRGNVPSTFATGVWPAETVTAPAAPFAPDPRVVGLLVAASAFVAFRAWTFVRRRRGRP